MLETLNYYHKDNNKKETVLFLHGFMSEASDWENIIEPYYEHFNVLLLDLPGFGNSKSFGIDYNMDDIGVVIVKILDELKLEKVHVVGYSMGGRVASSLLFNYSKRVGHAVLESTSLGINDEKKRKERVRIDEDRACRIESDYEKFLNDWENLGLFRSQEHLNPNVLGRQRQIRLKQDPFEVADSLRKYGTGVQPSYWKDMNVLNPVLILAGEKDEKFVLIGNQMQKVFRNSKFQVINDVGHNIHLENSVEFNRVVINFLLEGQ